MAAIKAKHQAARAVAEPTAMALAGQAAGAAPPFEAATPAPSGAQGTPERLGEQPQLTPDRLGEGGNRPWPMGGAVCNPVFTYPA